VHVQGCLYTHEYICIGLLRRRKYKTFLCGFDKFEEYKLIWTWKDKGIKRTEAVLRQ